MSKKRIDAILWRSYLAATSSALWELDNSQYYFELPRCSPDYEDFFRGRAKHSQDPRGNTAFTIRLEAFEGEPPAEPYDLKLTRLRDGTARAGNWQVLDQRGDSAYPLWQKNRGPLKPYQNMTTDEKRQNFIVIVRDVEGGLHGRWIRGDDLSKLPKKIRDLLTNKDVGWSKL